MELNYRVFTFSSEEIDGKAENLTLGSDLDSNSGWHSKRFWEYPQEIVIYFNSPVHLNKLVLLSHQNKISSQIDLYAYKPDVLNEISSKKYNRLGKFTLDDNSQSGYQARESKSVYLDTEWQYLKFVFSQCHVNKYNIFNQVSVQSIKWYGYTTSLSKRKSVPLVNSEYSDKSQIKSYMNNVNLKENLNKKINGNDGSFIGHFFQDKLKSLK